MTPEQFESIILDVAAGEATYRVLGSNSVNPKTFYAYMASNPEAGKQYARAKMQGLERLADECIDIADDSGLDYATDGDGIPRFASEAVQRARLRVDTRKWLLSKLAPKKYGEKIEQTHQGPDGGPILVQAGPTDVKL